MNFELENSYEVQEKIRSKRSVILPVGAVEAHGPHLPLGTDNLLAARLADKLAERTDSFVLPVLPYGQVWSLRNFPGSINVSNEALIRLLADIGESLYKQGFRVFVMVNGHLGNAVALKEAARVLYDRVPGLKVFYFFYPGTKEITAEVRETPAAHASYMHADEIETSYMLYLAEEYVDMSRAIDGAPHIPDDADCTPTPWEEMTSSAVLGDATLATKEKGRRIIERSLDVMAEMVLQAKREHAESPAGTE
ncbi:creatininase family protein [Paenibacillus doosanensis]|uniref:Creatinine amidohydrolase n=1 Tax=Paenibacillus konkukensis TaxID=2020716 RepID=A0ABY4RVM9_9BACL|nr:MULTISPECIES: creatininase family protein [Paenibacillus]MCS7460292.1 creatininase family protein [Paenibacillus doosanensis]UQZ86162.1 Creatinine amidohydrolase [Paenibacillus konkukensis]